MSLRLIKMGRTAAVLIGRTAAGTAVWSIAGGRVNSDDENDSRFTGEGGEDDGDDSDDEDETDEDDEDEDKPKDKGKGKSKGKGKKSDDSDEDDDDEALYTEDDMDKVRRRMRSADQRASRLDEELRTFKAGGKKPADDKGKSADDTSEEVAESRRKAETAEKKVRNLAVQNAFLRANTINWHNPEDALTNIDLSEIDVDEDGTVDRKQLARALRVLAKRKPYLVKPDVQSDADDEDDNGSDAQSGRRTAPAMNGKRKGSRKPTDRSELAKTFTVLNRR